MSTVNEHIANQGHPLPGEIERATAREYGWPGYFEVTFEKTENGSIPAFTLQQGGRQFRMKKQVEKAG